MRAFDWPRAAVGRGQRRIAAALALATFGAAASRDATAILMRHDVPDSAYIVADADYPALVDLLAPGDCLGTLVHASYLLTVAHCVEEMGTSRALIVNGVSHDVAEIILHPEWDGWRFDIAFVRFVEPVEGVTPFPIYRDTDELGQVLTLVGRGLHGTGVEGERGATDDAILRRATNIVSDTNPQWIEVLFEAPGEDGITDLEGVGAGGDSGGPAFIETEHGLFIAGLNSWAEGGPGVRIGQYGSWDYSTRVSQFVHWIDSVLPSSEGGDTGTDTDTGDPDTDDPPDSGDPDTSDPPDTGDSHGTDDEDGTETVDTDTGTAAGDVAADATSDDPKGAGQCGCASAGPAGGWLAMVAMLGLMRRRVAHT
jgi:MYXO-CTERM domain-containing protein